MATESLIATIATIKRFTSLRGISNFKVLNDTFIENNNSSLNSTKKSNDQFQKECQMEFEFNLPVFRILVRCQTTTLLVQIEGLLNSHPFSAVRWYLYPITPSHFLIGTNIMAVSEPCNEHLKNLYLSRWQNVEKLILLRRLNFC